MCLFSRHYQTGPPQCVSGLVVIRMPASRTQSAGLQAGHSTGRACRQPPLASPALVEIHPNVAKRCRVCSKMRLVCVLPVSVDPRRSPRAPAQGGGRRRPGPRGSVLEFSVSPPAAAPRQPRPPFARPDVIPRESRHLQNRRFFS